ncbi:dephospho-CoA kinase [Cavenderia fasciculata]|uniref:Dephospho-CoA kinase n=1 Tax=Cavenderia fasciculata TaxID=261658 RepID=F4PI89_CACFS|nr:dephospho-CoA kinase [Cavenderia fasciculata]EGG24523.1 dephospho-CoA kinase [Cavenderia fasciculata]|eukprot:XP_004362374.1 dephospho-CoA kinase [Cavenderia fasciculata]
MTKMIKIGLTGGIASGKSTILGYLSELGVKCIDADKVAHNVYQKDTDSYQKIVGEFGLDIVNEQDGSIDRRKLGPIVFSSADKMTKLCSIVWPEMKTIIQQQFDQYQQDNEPAVVLEAAVLVEAGFTELVDTIWVTKIDRQEAIKRICQRNNLSEQEAIKRIDSQLSNQEREQHATVVFDTTGDKEITKQKVLSEYFKLVPKK